MTFYQVKYCIGAHVLLIVAQMTDIFYVAHATHPARCQISLLFPAAREVVCARCYYKTVTRVDGRFLGITTDDLPGTRIVRV